MDCGVARAVLTNVKNLGRSRRPVGASTITQQVSRALLLDDNSKNLPRKIKEAMLAHRVEKKFSKEEILFLYLNEIFLGQNSFGVAAAAHFGPEAEIYAWPSAEGGALPLEGGVAVAFRREIAEAADPDAKRRELEEKLSSGRNPYTRAEAFGVHDMIDPRKTRSALCQWLELARPVLEERILGQRRTL